MNAAEQIIQIDQQIDANRRVMFNRLHVPPTTSAHAWQNAWDRCPDLYVRDRELNRQRGELQVQRDADDHKAWQSEQRSIRAKARAKSKTGLTLLCQCGLPILPCMTSCEMHA